MLCMTHMKCLYLKGCMIIQRQFFCNWKESQLHVSILHRLACQMQSTCKINHCCKGNATKENLQTRKIEWTNRTYSRTIGQKWDQSNSIWMCNIIYLTFAIFSKLQTNRKNEDIKTWKKKRWKTKQKNIYNDKGDNHWGKNWRQKLKIPIATICCKERIQCQKKS